MFFSAADAAIPKVRWKRSKMKHWFSYETIHLIRLKRRLYNRMVKSPTSDVIRSRYKYLSNLVRSRTRKDTEDYVSMLSNDYFVSPKPFWRWLNSYKGRHTSIPPLLHHNGHVSDDNPGLRHLMHILVLFLQLMMVLISLLYRKIYPFNHASSKLLNLMLKKYVMSCETSVVARPVVQIYCLPAYSGWVLS